MLGGDAVMYISKKKLLALWQAEVDKVETWNGVKNPQMLEMKHRAEGRRDAFLAILDAMNGNNFLLDSYLPNDKEI